MRRERFQGTELSHLRPVRSLDSILRRKEASSSPPPPPPPFFFSTYLVVLLLSLHEELGLLK